jgi:hypothetical protein
MTLDWNVIYTIEFMERNSMFMKIFNPFGDFLKLEAFSSMLEKIVCAKKFQHQLHVLITICNP